MSSKNKKRSNGIDGEEGFAAALNKAPLTETHKLLVAAIEEHDIVFAIGPAGTGKTFTSVKAGLQKLGKRDFGRLILSRPAVEAGEKLGFLPGNEQEKLAPYLRPLFDACNEIIGSKETKGLMAGERLEIASVAFMRGRTLSNAFIILDEAQNCTFEQLHMVLTRLGHGSKIVVTGDPNQTDLPGNQSGLKETLERLKSVPGVKIVELTEADNLRHPLVGAVSKAMAGGRLEPQSQHLQSQRPQGHVNGHGNGQAHGSSKGHLDVPVPPQ